jgi:two-component system sensor histidine kinase RegB
MSLDSGQMIGEASVVTTVGQLLDEVIAELANRGRVEVSDTPELRAVELRVPRVSLSQALRGIVQNALDAAPASKVAVRLGADAEGIVFSILDQGPGMPPEVLARAGEPFFTTKEPGKGMGLGLFLAGSVVERVGGTIELKSQHGAGTEAIVHLPTATDGDPPS